MLNQTLYLFSRLKPGASNRYNIVVTRENIYEDSFDKIIKEKNANLLRLTPWIDFKGEKAYDYGGVTREWFHLLTKEIFNPAYGLFECSAM